mgnify:CR=1 FL=1
MKIKLETKGAKEFYFKLKNFETSNVEAVKNTLNIAASLSRRNAVQNIKREFILRNKFTEKSITFQKADGNSINQLESKVGALDRAKYLKYQEDGGTKPKRGKNYAIAQKSARMGSNKNVISKNFYMSKIVSGGIKKGKPKLARGRRGNGVAQMYIANKFSKFVIRNKKIYRVDSFEKTSRNNVKAKMTLLYALQASPVKIKATWWMKRAVEKPSRDIDNIYVSQIKKLWRKGN